MKRPILWLTVLALIPPILIAAFLIGRSHRPVPAPDVSLGVMKSCAHLGALAKRVALDRDEGIPIDEARYRYYRKYLASRQSLFHSPNFALLLTYRAPDLQPETIRNLGVQTCVAAYYGFREPAHHDALYREALSCQQASSGETEPFSALDDCMGREYQRLLARWWQQAHDDGADLLATSSQT